MTKIYNWKKDIKDNELNNVIEALRNNELVILPAETVYGLAALSANLSTKPSGTCIEDIEEDFEGKVDLIVDGGKCNIGIESTVVKVINGVPVILRPGFITEDDIINVTR